MGRTLGAAALLLTGACSTGCGGASQQSATAANENEAPPAQMIELAQTGEPSEPSGGEQPSETAANEAPPVEDAPPVEIVAGSLRLVVVADHELLGSEERRLRAIERALTHGGRRVDSASPSPEEEATAAAWISGNAPAQVPAAWRGVETVLALRIAPPTQMNARPVSRGLAGTLLLRAPATEPVYRSHVDDAAAWALTDDRVPSWVVELVSLAASSAPEAG